MAEPAKKDGRKVQGLNRETGDEIAAARKALYDVLWERDPVVVGRAVKKALGMLDDAMRRVNEIEVITRVAAVRGPYDQEDE
jgi:hypothetical protein